MWGKKSLPPAPPPSKLPPFEQLYIFAAIAAILVALLAIQRRRAPGRWLPSKGEKREYEVWALKYSVVWMGSFAVIIAFQLYEAFDALTYFVVCGGLALPLVLQPLVARGPAGKKAKSVVAQHAVRAQLWIALFGFVGNYWYTHYFYCVLRAIYTMPAWRLNGVPIAMFFATHFYFSSYHVLANLVLRKARTAHAPGWRRAALTVALIGAMSYTTAFMETLTISNFPYYDFENRDMAYTVGSAFYGLYFIVSFPVYHALDEPDLRGPASLADVAFSSLGSAMAVLLLLDVSRLLLGVPLTIGGALWEVTG